MNCIIRTQNKSSLRNIRLLSKSSLDLKVSCRRVRACVCVCVCVCHERFPNRPNFNFWTLEENPTTHARIIERQCEVAKSTENRVGREQLIHPFHVQSVQEIIPADPETRYFSQILSYLSYLELLQNALNQMYFIHDSAPPHFADNVTQYLNKLHPNGSPNDKMLLLSGHLLHQVPIPVTSSFGEH